MSNSINVEKETIAMLEEFVQDVEVPSFFSSTFSVPRRGIHNSKKLKIDTSKEDEIVAVPVDSAASDYNYSQYTGFDTAEIKPPVYKEAFEVSADELSDRSIGKTPYEDPEFQMNAAQIAVNSMGKQVKKIKRALELQASQIYFNKGIIDLKDADGNEKFYLDYKLDSLLFPDAATAWDGTTPPIINDILQVCYKVRELGGVDPTRLILDGESLEAALEQSDFRERFNLVNADLGALNGSDSGSKKGNLMGNLRVGEFLLDIYTYAGAYKAPDGTWSKYLPKGNAMVWAPSRRDATFGRIAKFESDRRVLRYVPARVTQAGRLFDMSVNAWMGKQNESFSVGVGTRPLLIPRNKGAFGVISTLIS